MNNREGKANFFKGMATVLPIMCLWMFPYPCAYRQHKEFNKQFVIEE